MGRLIGQSIKGGVPEFNYNINEAAFQIPDAQKYRDKADTQYGGAVERGNYIQPKQRSFIETLEQQASGQGPSLATEQLKSAQNRNLAQQVAAAQASRSPSGALTQRNLLRTQQEGAAQVAEQSAQARIQEQLLARTMLGQQIGQERQASDQLTQNYLAQGFSMAQAQQQAAADLERMKYGLAQQKYQGQLANYQQRSDMVDNQIGDIQKVFSTIFTGGMAGGGGGTTGKGNAGGSRAASGVDSGGGGPGMKMTPIG